ncbi:DNA-directed RNA polymerase II subunit RPB9 [Rhizophlyctis rosea]|nr:DNA-directed RNA polymerase II subunit RPB9 [Rhizophlyctis rosea]
MNGVTENDCAKPKFQFCPECRSLLYPRTFNDDNRPKLLLSCRLCPYFRVVTDDSEKIISSQIMAHDRAKDLQDLPDLREDKTYPVTHKTPGRTYACPKCGVEDAVFFQARHALVNPVSKKDTRDHTSMKVVYICRNKTCNHRWAIHTKPDVSQALMA